MKKRDRCLYCGDKCVEHFVYVIGRPRANESVKVGYSRRPVRRLAAIRKKTGRDVSLIHLEPIDCQVKAMEVETEAHRALAQFWGGLGEWFDCEEQTAVSAVQSAATTLGRGPTRP